MKAARKVAAQVIIRGIIIAAIKAVVATTTKSCFQSELKRFLIKNRSLKFRTETCHISPLSFNTESPATLKQKQMAASLL